MRFFHNKIIQGSPIRTSLYILRYRINNRRRLCKIYKIVKIKGFPQITTPIEYVIQCLLVLHDPIFQLFIVFPDFVYLLRKNKVQK